MDETEQAIDDLIQETAGGAADTESSGTIEPLSILSKLYSLSTLSAENLLQGNGLAVGMLSITAAVLSKCNKLL